jgi:hypothetical protein
MPSNGELSILGLIKTILPDGTTRARSWDGICDWPPDLFAAVATITERSGLYAEPIFTAYWKKRQFALSPTWIRKTRALGKDWAESGTPPEAVAQLWSQLIQKHGSAHFDDASGKSLEWKKIVFQLLTIADEACAGIGFPLPANMGSGRRRRPVSAVQYLVANDYVAWEAERRRTPKTPVMGGNVLPYLPHSLCVRVPPAIACVQPKTNTPAVGCTLRSLTHNLAFGCQCYDALAACQ